MPKTALNKKPTIYLALPLMDELEHISNLLESVALQSYQQVKVVACVNHPEIWRSQPVKSNLIRRNEATLSLLQKKADERLTVIDRCSMGRGWNSRHFGVGWARKTIMDHISKFAGEDDIIVSMDGDTRFSPGYFEEIVRAFANYPQIKGLTIPYYHPLPEDDPAAARAILRYEIYMRHYALNMLRIGNPYAFTAIGSAMACTVKSYRDIGGITPHKSGEDFYFVQKLRKYGSLLIWLDQKVYPAARFSDRVFFGTGPAMIRGAGGDWSGYPVYPYQFFDEIKTTFDGFAALFYEDIQLPMSHFLKEKFGEDFWAPLRKNAKTADRFVKACHDKVDGLRILQYLKWRNEKEAARDEENLKTFLMRFLGEDEMAKDICSCTLDFEQNSIEELNRIRDYLTQKEDEWRKQVAILR